MVPSHHRRRIEAHNGRATPLPPQLGTVAEHELIEIPPPRDPVDVLRLLPDPGEGSAREVGRAPIVAGNEKERIREGPETASHPLPLSLLDVLPEIVGVPVQDRPRISPLPALLLVHGLERPSKRLQGLGVAILSVIGEAPERGAPPSHLLPTFTHDFERPAPPPFFTQVIDPLTDYPAVPRDAVAHLRQELEQLLASPNHARAIRDRFPVVPVLSVGETHTSHHLVAGPEALLPGTGKAPSPEPLETPLGIPCPIPAPPNRAGRQRRGRAVARPPPAHRGRAEEAL